MVITVIGPLGIGFATDRIGALSLGGMFTSGAASNGSGSPSCDRLLEVASPLPSSWDGIDRAASSVGASSDPKTRGDSLLQPRQITLATASQPPD